jgi:hypothetical protein
MRWKSFGVRRGEALEEIGDWGKCQQKAQDHQDECNAVRFCQSDCLFLPTEI